MELMRRFDNQYSTYRTERYRVALWDVGGKFILPYGGTEVTKLTLSNFPSAKGLFERLPLRGGTVSSYFRPTIPQVRKRGGWEGKKKFFVCVLGFLFQSQVSATLVPFLVGLCIALDSTYFMHVSHLIVYILFAPPPPVFKEETQEEKSSEEV